MSERYGSAFTSFTTQFKTIISDVHADLAKAKSVQEVKPEQKMNLIEKKLFGFEFKNLE